MGSCGYRSDATVRVARLFKLLGLIRAWNRKHCPTAVEMALQCGCSRATLFRDLRLLQDEGLIAPDNQRGYLFLDKGMSFPMVPLSAEDALALALARSLLVRPDIPMRQEIQSALDKAASAFSPRIRKLFVQATAGIVSAPQGPDLSQAPLATLIEGWLKRTTIEMDYDSIRSGRRTRLLDPYLVTAEGGLWMVHGWCHENRALLTFALDRLHTAQITPRSFERDEDAWSAFIEEEGVFLGLRGGPPVAVQVRFSPEVARYALRHSRWPKGLSTAKQPDGTVLLTGTASGVDGIVVEVLRWRRYACVEGGPELLAAVRAEIEEMAKFYRTPPESRIPVRR